MNTARRQGRLREPWPTIPAAVLAQALALSTITLYDLSTTFTEHGGKLTKYSNFLTPHLYLKP